MQQKRFEEAGNVGYKILKTHPRLSTFNQNRLRSSRARCCFSPARIDMREGIGARELKLYCFCLLPLKGTDCTKMCLCGAFQLNDISIFDRYRL